MSLDALRWQQLKEQVLLLSRERGSVPHWRKLRFTWGW